MASYEGRRSFLLGMTLNELAFMMFFLLMLLSTAALHHKAEQLQQETLKNAELQQEINQTHRDLDESFKRLQLLENTIGRISGLGPDPTPEQLDQAFEKLQAAENIDQVAVENIRLKNELELLQTELKQIAPNAQPLKTLRVLIEKSQTEQRDRQSLRGQLHFLQQQLRGNGLDHPPCWADPETGTIQYLYRITIHERALSVEPAWPDSRNQELRSIPGALALAGQSLSLETFKTKSEPVFQWSIAHECRHFVRIHDDPLTTKRSFKTALLTIESVFYKFLEH
ncbi:MAG: hypothetical protein ACU85E_06295 [Gammaproteobacteria bacterium]